VVPHRSTNLGTNVKAKSKKEPNLVPHRSTNLGSNVKAKSKKEPNVVPHRSTNLGTNVNAKSKKRTTPGIPTWSPTVVLTWGQT
jgi:hypothetical protein